jgi:hypothetical protein
MSGIWKNDSHVGPKPSTPKVATQYNVISTSFVRTGEGNEISISFYQNHITNQVTYVDITTRSGNEIRSGNIINLWDIRFPFNCKINYVTWNSLKTQQYDCILEFEINQPGSWDLRIEN